MRKFRWIIFLFLLLLLSYSREVSFLSINAVISGSDQFWAKTTRIDFFLDKSPEFLVRMKYIMTIGFTAIFAVVTALGLRFSFTSKTPYTLSILAYSLCVIIAAIVLAYALLIDSFSSVYSFLRLIIDYLHNPLIYLILSASFLGYSYSQKQSV